MRTHKLIVTVRDNHEIIVRLPDDFPPGEAEITVVSCGAEEPTHADDFAWLEKWGASLPSAPPIPLETRDSAELYR